MKRKLLIIPVLLVLVMLTACTPAAPSISQGKVGGKINVAITTSVTGVDPLLAYGADARVVANHCFEALVTWNYDYVVAPQLAESWTISADNTVYTFKLRKGVKFQNGKEMTSADVLASFKRFAAQSSRKNVLANVKEYNIPDAYTFEIVLTKSQPVFIQDLATPTPSVFITPAEDEDIPLGKMEVEDAIGTGPYKITEFVLDQHITVTRFDGYCQLEGSGPSGLTGTRTAYLDEIKFDFVPEKASRLNGLLANEYDYAASLDSTNYEQLKSNPDFQPSIMNPYFKVFCLANTINSPSGIMQNVKIRQAILKGLDCDAIVLAAGGGTKNLSRADHSLFTMEQFWYSKNGLDKFNNKDIAGAKALLAEAGYNGQELIIVTNKDFDFMYQAAIVFQSQLKDMGIKTRLEVVDWPTNSKWASTPAEWPRWDIAFNGNSLRFDPTGYNINYNSANKFYPYDNPAMNNLLNEGMMYSDINKRKEIYNKVMDLFYEDVPSYYFGDVFSLDAYSSKLVTEKGWYTLRFWDAWLK